MIIVLNGPLGIGKSTLSEALVERIDRCAMLDGDALVEVKPPPVDPIAHLHRGIERLLEHHWEFGYRNFVINHFWATVKDLDDLCHRLSRFDEKVFRYRLTLDPASNLRRIDKRAGSRAADERDHEISTFYREYEVLNRYIGDELGERIDATDPPEALADFLLRACGRTEAG